MTEHPSPDGQTQGLCERCDHLQARLTQVEGALRLERRTTPPSQWAVVLPVLKRLEAALIPLASTPPKEHEEQEETRVEGFPGCWAWGSTAIATVNDWATVI